MRVVEMSSRFTIEDRVGEILEGAQIGGLVLRPIQKGDFVADGIGQQISQRCD